MSARQSRAPTSQTLTKPACSYAKAGPPPRYRSYLCGSAVQLKAHRLKPGAASCRCELVSFWVYAGCFDTVELARLYLVLMGEELS